MEYDRSKIQQDIMSNLEPSVKDAIKAVKQFQELFRTSKKPANVQIGYGTSTSICTHCKKIGWIFPAGELLKAMCADCAMSEIRINNSNRLHAVLPSFYDKDNDLDDEHVRVRWTVVTVLVVSVIGLLCLVAHQLFL